MNDDSTHKPIDQEPAEPVNPETPESVNPEPSGNVDPEPSEKGKPVVKKRGPKWLRVTAKVLMWLVIAILLIPLLLYIPPVQTLVKNVACDIVYKKTGMKLGIGQFRLKFPLDVSLKDVYVVEASGDTMVRAREAIADVKLLPLLKLDIDINKLKLNDGYYRFMNPDSSMIVKVKAGELTVDDQSSMSLGKSEINLNKALLRNGNVQVYMNVWKQKPTPPDTAPSTPFLIMANDLKIENLTFGLGMLPTIDTLKLQAANVELKKGVIDLRQNLITWKRAGVSDGEATYLTPTAEYIKTHPAPPPLSSSGTPMRIKGDSLSLSGFKALYATKGAKPLPGFDAAYISVDGVTVGMRDFYNESSTVRLPITRLEARERSGLQIVSGSGTVGVDSVGLNLTNLKVRTPYSELAATAAVPFALMEMKPDADMDVEASGRIGMPDIEAFMPALKEYTAKVPARKPLDFEIEAAGSLSHLDIGKLTATMPAVIDIDAAGYVDNPLDMKKLRADIDFKGTLSDPRIAEQFTGESGVKVPAFTIDGYATADAGTYAADFRLNSTAGNMTADGRVSIDSERYDISASVEGLNVAEFMPALGVGAVTASIKADGAGFNPVSGSATTHADIDIASIVYNKRLLHDIRANIQLLPDGVFDIYAVSPNQEADLILDGTGVIKKDDYTFDIRASIRNLDLKALGMSDSICDGKGEIWLSGTASPERWLYNADLKVSDLDWNLPGEYLHIPGGVAARIVSTETTTNVNVDTQGAALAFNSASGLKNVVDKFMAASGIVTKQIETRNIAVDTISNVLPPFSLTFNVSGNGVLRQFLAPSGMALDTVYGHLTHDSLLYGDIRAMDFKSTSVNLDTIHLNLKERGQLLDYRAHVGNRPGTFDEFSQMNLNGYLGTNRLGAFFTQKNLKGETGYRIGLTAAMADSTVNLHFTPLKSTIAYMPWTFNLDNYIEYNLYNKHISADLQAGSAESKVMLRTENLPDGNEQLHAKLENLHIQDFMGLMLDPPSVSGTVNSDLTVIYSDRRFKGKGTLDIKDLIYEKTRLGDFDIDMNAGYALNGNTDVTAAMMINSKPALSLFANMRSDSIGGFVPDSLGVNLTRFPLSVANPFLGKMAQLGGSLDGGMRMDGSFTNPVLNGALLFDSVTVRIPMAASTLRFAQDSVTVRNNVVDFDKFNIYGQNSNPIVLDGTVDATDFSKPAFNLSLTGNNVQLIKNDRRSKADLYGKLFMNVNATVKGPMNHFDVKGNLTILGKTDLTYNLGMSPSEMNMQTDENIVKFVNFNDTTQVAKADSVAPAAMSMRVIAGLTIDPGTQVKVLLSTNGTDRVEVAPTANLNYFQNYMGDMRLNGTVTTGAGFVRYSIPAIGEKMFSFDPNSTIVWSGAVMNPTLNITATDDMKANVTTSGNSRLVNFLITLRAAGTLERPTIKFDLSTNDDLTIQNELSSMSADQRQTQAMNLLLYGQYTGQNTRMAGGNMAENMLYGLLESQLNSWAAKNIRGVDLSFGIDQYDKTNNGATSTQTSYSYQVSKTLFNNRFKIQVGGNYSTDSSPDENLAQNLVSDISFEYILKQTQTTSMAVKLFRHTGFESILEGEITETGAGFVMKRKLNNLFHLFRFRRARKKDGDIPEPEPAIKKETAEITDSTKENK